jgi:hypothetical protein
MEYTVEVFKQDKRSKAGERRVAKVDVESADRMVLEFRCALDYPASKGFRYTIHETYVTRKNLMGGNEFTERYDTPSYCSPSSESYWSM